MRQYLDLLGHILNTGVTKSDRTGVGTQSIFGHQMRFDLEKGFPLVTTKKVHFKSMTHELLWFLSGSTNIKYLKDNKVRIWDDWADAQGELGPIYGFQWRSWPDYSGGAIDQITNVIERIKTKPNDRRLIVSAWNVAQVEQMSLPPCHLLFQFYTANGKLSCQMYQRSCDTFLGVPFNIASYALLTMMVAHVTGYKPGEFIWVGGDTHLYLNHFEQARSQLIREPRHLPKVVLNPEIKSILDFGFEDVQLLDYDPHPHIPAPIAV